MAMWVLNLVKIEKARIEQKNGRTYFLLLRGIRVAVDKMKCYIEYCGCHTGQERGLKKEKRKKEKCKDNKPLRMYVLFILIDLKFS